MELLTITVFCFDDIDAINIIKTKESLNSDGQQFHQYHQNKRQFKQ
jgi:hypothetical protein